jgi:hypothetical protein
MRQGDGPAEAPHDDKGAGGLGIGGRCVATAAMSGRHVLMRPAPKQGRLGGYQVGPGTVQGGVA